MKKMNFKKGFTLIELLVVVAIIGILASVVLASLTSARSKGKDAAVFAQLSNMRAQAELYYATNGNYGMNTGAAGTGLGATGGAVIMSAACAAQNSAGTIFTATAANSGLASLVAGACASGGQNISGALDASSTLTVGSKAWAVYAQGASSTAFYCVDSTGASKSYGTSQTISAGAVCP